MDLQEVIKQGYTVTDAWANGMYFRAVLRKPDEMIANELPKLTELAKAEYAELRYASNVAETQRWMQLTIEKRARDAAAAKAKEAAEHKAAEEAFALADLLKAYSPKTKTKVKQEVAA
jgi:predicted HAD superfamily Cof-like phosphohydrolase